jgi:hypothetical protein
MQRCDVLIFGFLTKEYLISSHQLLLTKDSKFLFIPEVVSLALD